jgi:hypothetical protein
MQQERNKMRSFVNSPLTCTGAHWRWFFTAAQSDLFNPIIYDHLIAASPAVHFFPPQEAWIEDQTMKMIKNIILSRAGLNAFVWTIRPSQLWL